MCKTGKKSEPPTKADAGARKPPPPSTAENEDYEDGDIATPKRDRYGTDDEPL